MELEAKEVKDFYIVFKDKVNLTAKNVDYKYFSIEYNDNGVTSLKYKNEELLTNDVVPFGFPVYECFPNGKRQEAAGFGYSKRNIPQTKFSYPTNVKLNVKEIWPLFTVLEYTMELESTKKAIVEMILYKELPEIKVNVMVAKDLVIDPEGLYVCFPFATNNKKCLMDKSGTLIEPGVQLSSTCCDYYALDKGVILSSDKVSIAVNTLDTPMVTFEKIKLWNYSTTIENKGSLFSWVLNNKWEINFRTDCAGYLESRYVISFSDDLDSAINKLSANDAGVIVVRK